MHLDLNISKDHYNMLSFIEEFNPCALKDAIHLEFLSFDIQ